MAAKKSMKKAASKLKAKAKAVRAKASTKLAARKNTMKAKASRMKAPKQKLQAIPPDMPTVIPNLTIRGAAEAIEFYKRAFGAKEIMRQVMPGSDIIWHCQLRFGSSPVFVNDEMPGQSAGSSGERPTPTSMWIWTKSVDADFNRAVAAGAKVTMQVMDQFWGDRMGMITDRWGISWALTQHVKDMTPEEMVRAGEEFAKSQGGGPAMDAGASSSSSGMGDMPPPSSGGSQSSTGGAMV